MDPQVVHAVLLNSPLVAQILLLLLLFAYSNKATDNLCRILQSARNIFHEENCSCRRHSRRKEIDRSED